MIIMVKMMEIIMIVMVKMMTIIMRRVVMISRVKVSQVPQPICGEPVQIKDVSEDNDDEPPNDNNIHEQDERCFRRP